MRPKQFWVAREVTDIHWIPDFQFTRERKLTQEAMSRYFPNAPQMTVLHLPKLFQSYRGEVKPKFEDFARDAVENYRFTTWGKLLAAYNETPPDKANAFCCALVVALGDILVREFSLSWALAKDKYGTGRCLVNGENTFAAFVFDMVDVDAAPGNPDVWQDAYDYVRDAFFLGPVPPPALPNRTLAEIEAEVDELIEEWKQLAMVLRDMQNRMVSVHTGTDDPQLVRKATEFMEESKRLQARLGALMGELGEWRTHLPEEVMLAEDRITAKFKVITDF
jgi:hypothetical protein